MQLVAPVADHQQQPRVPRPAGEHPQHIKRRLVGPVHVLEDQQHRRNRPERLAERDRDVERLRSRRRQLRWIAPELCSRLEQRAERTWREQRITAARQRCHTPRKLIAELAQQRRLADPGLARHDRDATLARRGHLGGQSVKHAQLLRAFEQSQSHGAILRPACAPLIGKVPYLAGPLNLPPQHTRFVQAQHLVRDSQLGRVRGRSRKETGRRTRRSSNRSLSRFT